LVSFFISGGLTGLWLGNAAIDINLHDTYFVVAHFHLVMGSAAIFGMFAGIYHWFPKLFGREINPRWGYLHFWLTFASAYLVFFPMHFMGLDGVPRRYYAFTAFEYMRPWLQLNKFISVAAVAGALAQIIFLVNFFWSMFRGRKATLNPWHSNTLEWTTPLNPGHGNWPGEIPHVHRWPYDYSRPDTEEDYVPQNVPDHVVPEEVAEPHTAPQPVLANGADGSAGLTERVFFFAGLLNFLRLRR
jgi:cytochrome c oxidase subunit 1